MKPILAIDPGPVESAYVLWDGAKVLGHDKLDNRHLLDNLRSAAFARANLPELAVEMIASYGMPVGREVFETCVWIGRFIEAWARAHGEEAVLTYRQDVKLHLCGSARAKDANIRQAIIDKIGAPGTKKQPGPTYGLKGDEWAALALALTIRRAA